MLTTENTDQKQIFTSLKKILSKYNPPFVNGNVKTDKSQYHLWSKVPVSIQGRKPKQVYFAGIIIQKNFVGFYYMPVYTNSKLKQVFEPELLSMLKGKSCFHIKKLDSKIEKQIASALKIGFKMYKEHKWI